MTTIMRNVFPLNCSIIITTQHPDIITGHFLKDQKPQERNTTMHGAPPELKPQHHIWT